MLSPLYFDTFRGGENGLIEPAERHRDPDRTDRNKTGRKRPGREDRNYEGQKRMDDL